jgi:hypothetical protein
MKRFIAIMITLAFCLPAQAEILIFKTATTGQQFDIENKLLERKKEGGYFVIDADLSNPDSVSVNEAYHLHYETRAGNKIQYTTILGDVEVILIDAGKGKKMVLRYFDEPTGTYMVVYGTATLKDIGSLRRYVAGSLSGHDVWRQQDFRTGSGSIRLRLDINASRTANTTPGKTAMQIIDEYEQTLETTKGYIPE